MEPTAGRSRPLIACDAALIAVSWCGGHLLRFYVASAILVVSMVMRRLHESRAREGTIAGSAVAILLVSHLYVGYRSEFIPCTVDCGETYHAYMGALNLHKFGFTYAGGLEDVAASPEFSAHPTLYTHNANIGVYARYLLFRLGITDVHSQAAWMTVPFLAGLLYMYLFVRSATQSGVLAALCLLNAATLYLLVTLWAFHGLRVFSWLLTFAPAYHLYRYRKSGRQAHQMATGIYLALALGIDYTFAVFTGLNLIGLTLLRIIRMPFTRVLSLVVISMGISFALRQLQVAAIVGPTFWFFDFAHSVTRRVPLVGAFFDTGEAAATLARYTTYNILQWPSPIGFEPLQWMKIIASVYLDVLGRWIVVVLAFWAVALLAMRPKLVQLHEAPAARCLAVIVSVTGALMMTFCFFGGYFAILYGSGLLPLVVHAVIPLLGTTSYVLLANVDRSVQLGRSMIPAGRVLLVLFILLRAEVEISLRLEFPPLGYPGREALRELRGYSMVTVWVSTAVSAYTHQWAARLHDPRWREIRVADLPFDPDHDYYFFFEADRHNPRYRTPDFLFVPAINVPWVVDRRCNPFRGRVGLPVDGCTDLEGVAQRFNGLPRYRRGEDYLIYDLRPLYRSASQGP